jgi:hypothetical protein
MTFSSTRSLGRRGQNITTLNEPIVPSLDGFYLTLSKGFDPLSLSLPNRTNGRERDSMGGSHQLRIYDIK